MKYAYNFKQQHWSAVDYAFCVNNGLTFVWDEENMAFCFEFKHDFDMYFEYKLKNCNSLQKSNSITPEY